MICTQALTMTLITPCFPTQSLNPRRWPLHQHSFSLAAHLLRHFNQQSRVTITKILATNLQGAPYGYTPFCDNNKDMEGFRFWKQGFWKEHLRGKPYHISALFVVDLGRFRQGHALHSEVFGWQGVAQ